jgi:RHS repeat-associated protein
MGCLKLTYYQEEAQGENSFFSGNALEKRGQAEKKRLSPYRYGFNGMERDDEMKGLGNSYTTRYRLYDPRLGKWFSVDPKTSQMPWQSPYNSMDNNPVCFIDPFGDKVPISGEKADQNTLIAQINQATGGKYRINRKGDLKAKFGNYGKSVTGKLFKEAIKSDNILPIEAVSNDDQTFFDGYASTTVDVGDIGKGDVTFQKGIYAHFMAERLAAGAGYADPSKRKSDIKKDKLGGLTGSSNFEKYHDEGLKYESLAIGESLGIPKLAIRSDKLVEQTNALGVKSILGMNFTYGTQVEFNISIPEKTLWLGKFSANRLLLTPVSSIKRTK